MYLFQIKEGVSEPVRVTWVLWLFAGIVNAFNYYQVVDQDVWKTLMATVHTIGLAVIYAYTWKIRGFKKEKHYELVALIPILAGVAIYWLLSKEHNKTSIAIQVITILSFLPTINGIRTKGAKEKPRSWYVSVLAYLFLFGAILLDPKGWDVYDFAFPGFRGLLCVAVIYFAETHRIDKT
jgi:hypothetical protein